MSYWLYSLIEPQEQDNEFVQSKLSMLLDRPCVNTSSFELYNNVDNLCHEEFPLICHIDERCPYFYFREIKTCDGISMYEQIGLRITIEGGTTERGTKGIYGISLGFLLEPSSDPLGNPYPESEINRKMRDMMLGFKPYPSFRRVVDYFHQLVGNDPFYIEKLRPSEEFDMYYVAKFSKHIVRIAGLY